MSSAFDALPAIVPFFGVLLSSFTVGFCLLNRRMRNLSNRVAELESQRQNPPQILIDRPPILTPPPIYPTYPIQQQQQQYPYYNYQQPNPQPSAPYSTNSI